jgi:antitoxin component of MazEF toxin-antitoxin module
MQAQYSLKVQAIRSKKQKPRLYVYLPAALAEAISLEPGEDVRWELLDRGELHLVREVVPPTKAKHHGARQS